MVVLYQLSYNGMYYISLDRFYLRSGRDISEKCFFLLTLAENAAQVLDHFLTIEGVLWFDTVLKNH